MASNIEQEDDVLEILALRLRLWSVFVSRFFPPLKVFRTVAIEPRAVIVFSCTIDPVIMPLGLQAVI